MQLLNGCKKQSQSSFWKMWTEELKVSFNKKSFTDALMERWNLTYPNVITRLKNENFPYMTADIQWMYENFAVGFTIEKGFFFDTEKAVLIEKKSELEAARFFGLSK